VNDDDPAATLAALARQTERHARALVASASALLAQVEAMRHDEPAEDYRYEPGAEDDACDAAELWTDVTPIDARGYRLLKHKITGFLRRDPPA
jgi:hypothetical protein